MQVSIPAYVRSFGPSLETEDRAYLRRKLARRLGKFAPSIERVSVRFEDLNGPRGGTDKACRIKVVLRGLPSVVVETRDAALQAAMDGALAQIETAVKRSIQRRRTKRMRPRSVPAVTDSAADTMHAE